MLAPARSPGSRVVRIRSSATERSVTRWSQQLHLRGLPGAIPSLEGDEHSAAGRMRGGDPQPAHGLDEALAGSSPG